MDGSTVEPETPGGAAAFPAALAPELSAKMREGILRVYRQIALAAGDEVKAVGTPAEQLLWAYGVSPDDIPRILEMARRQFEAGLIVVDSRDLTSTGAPTQCTVSGLFI